MEYRNIRRAVFLSRPNRFIANVEIDGVQQVCHVKNTGRCRELLLPGAEVYVEECPSDKRKTAFDLIAVNKGGRLINMDSSAPNKVFGEYVSSGAFTDGVTLIRPECRFGSSRFDFYLEAGERKIFVEVKGVTLENDGVVSFPDAPTERGVKHLKELAGCVKCGYEAFVVFIVQMNGVKYLRPNWETHPEFGSALYAAQKAGVQIRAYDCFVSVNSLSVAGPVDVVTAPPDSTGTTRS